MAGFQRARCHSQRVAELGHVLPQYYPLLAAGFGRLYIHAHRVVMSTAAKEFIIHIFTSWCYFPGRLHFSHQIEGCAQAHVFASDLVFTEM